MSIITFDTETTKLDGEVIELAVLIDENYQSILQDYIKPNGPITIEAMAVHNITEDMVANAGSISSTNSLGIINMMNSSDNYLIAHNINFDIDQLARNASFNNQYKLIDTYKVAYHLWDYPKHTVSYLRYKLDGVDRKFKEIMKTRFDNFIKSVGSENIYEIMNHPDYNKYRDGAHNAIPDVVVTRLLFDYMLNFISIDEMIDVSTRPILFRKFSSGKYSGKSFEEVAYEDPGYINYMINFVLDKKPTKEAMVNDSYLQTLLHWKAKVGC